MSTNEAIESLLALAGPAFRIERTDHNQVRVDVFSLKSKRGKVLMPLNLNLEVEIFVTLDEENQSYRFNGHSFETSGFSMRTERFTGIYRRKEWGKHLTLDGVQHIKFDTGAVFDRIEEVLRAQGWRRR